MYQYLIIESKKPMIDHESFILSMFSEFFEITHYNTSKDQIVIYFEQLVDISFKEVAINLTLDLYEDFRIYESYTFHSEQERENHVNLMKERIDRIPFLHYNYLNDKTVLEYYIHQIDHELKKLFLRKYHQDILMIETIKAYLESDQNMVLASKKLYVHRNTLIQRIDKFLQETGFDVRKFKDALLIYLLIK